MNSVMLLLKEKWHALNPLYRKYLKWGTAIIIIVFLFILSLVFSHQSKQLPQQIIQVENQRTVLLAEQINGMRAQIDKLAIGTQNLAQVSKLGDGLLEIEKNVTGVAKSNELQKIALEMKEQLNSLEKAIYASGHIKQYLDPQSLPFQVISIDMISQEPFVSVEYEHHITPLGLGDSLTGWKMERVDYAAVEAEFQNNQGQYVKVNAPGRTKFLEEK